MTTIRPATPADIAEIHAMIVELAVYEREPDAVKASVEDLQQAFFGPRPVAEALIAETDAPDGTGTAAGAAIADGAVIADGGAGGARPAVIGHAIFYETFSTWEGKAGIWLEDFYVRPAHRGTGAGAALFRELASITVQRGYTRYEWVALNWNTPALDFYKRFGAVRLDEWVIHRLSGDTLAAVAAPATAGT